MRNEKVFDPKKRKLLLYGRAVLDIVNSTRFAGLGNNLGTVQVAGCNSDSTARFVLLNMTMVGRVAVNNEYIHSSKTKVLDHL